MGERCGGAGLLERRRGTGKGWGQRQERQRWWRGRERRETEIVEGEGETEIEMVEREGETETETEMVEREGETDSRDGEKVIERQRWTPWEDGETDGKEAGVGDVGTGKRLSGGGGDGERGRGQ